MLANAIIAHLLILLTWAAYALVILGFSAWYLRAFLKTPPTLSDFFTAFWVGLATLLALLQLWHFFAPLDSTAHISLLLVGTLGFLAIAPNLLKALRTTPRRPLLTGLALLSLTAFWLANRATGPGAEYDSGLYHIAAVKWSRLFHIVPGLANLHMRFGFSSTITLLSAWMDHGPWAGNANHLVNCFFLVALSATIIRSALRIRADPSAFAPHDWLLVFSTLLVIDWSIDIQAASYSTDIGSVTLTIAAAHYFLKSFAEPSRLPPNALACALLAAAAVTAKASTLILCAPMTAIILALLWQKSPTRRLRAILPTLLASALLIVPWLVRQVILTGYPLYPSELFGFPVDWKVPFEKVQWLRRIMLNWDLWIKYEPPVGYEWFPIWLKTRIFQPVTVWKAFIPTLIATLSLLLAAIRWPKLRKLRSEILGPVCLFACTLLAALVWYKTAPDPRYASQIFVLMMAAALLLPLASLTPASRKVLTKPLLALTLLFALGPFFLGTQEAQRLTGHTLAGIWLLPPEAGLFYPTPQSAIQQITTATGLQIYIPIPPPGKTFEDRPWDAPLPNTPISEIDPTEVQIPPLRLRTPGDLQRGFKRTP